MARNVAVIGSSIGAAQAALTLAELGVEVALITTSASFGPETIASSANDSNSEDMLRLWPLLLRAASHPLVTLFTNSQVKDIKGKQGKFTIKAIKQPRYVREDLCSSCGRCEEACSVKIRSLVNGQKLVHSAIHAPLPGSKSVPSAYFIEKNGVAPCRAACPLGIKVQGFISLLSKGKVDDALNLINEAAPLAGILGRVCTHPCENDCKRGEVDNPVFIQALHRYAADNASGIRYNRKAPAGSKKEKIAILGSGPSGLTAAWELARRGYTPTIFESHATVGGMLATGIPRFRLPREVREREVEAIRALGVDMKTGITVGRDVTIMDLRERGYQAFFIAIGAHKNNKLDIPGEDLDEVVGGISLLFALNQKVGVSVGSNIVVIGGGNSAVDSARTAKRSSKGKVRIIYRRTAGEMTAVKEDIEEAIKEGIKIEYLTSPVEIIGDGTKVTGIRCQKMRLGEVGPDGRRTPEPIPGSEFLIKADHVVVAIGQLPDTALMNSRGLAIN
ncbi:MAG TPA: FAD-dependent oxidoreductase, partial [Dehalococcoidia bacterium]|nr:FAD-dependent oxidoreductase [Dehalococcoidia bacterium]